jgi:hypothetical protein
MCVSAHLTFYIGGKGTCTLSKKKMIFSLYPFGLAHTREGACVRAWDLFF